MRQLFVSNFKYLFLVLFASTMIYCKSDVATDLPEEKEDVAVKKLNEEDILKLKAKGFVLYSDLGAKGNGKNDDLEAIVATHKIANEHDLEVKADEGANYYLGGRNLTAEIKTNTDFNTATFTIDDTEVYDLKSNIFLVKSTLQPFTPEAITSLKKNQSKINISLPTACLITVVDGNVKQYIRKGANQNSGNSKTDIFHVDKDGNVDMKAPVIWDFDQITSISAIPIDEKTLTIKGGKFVTIANRAASKYTYYNRGLKIKRSNVVVDGLEHHITGEGSNGAPYSGFITTNDCINVTIQNCILTGHKTYKTIGSAGTSVSMGTYDISFSRSLNISLINCSQTNDINDRTYWGIMASNYCKNIVLDNCSFSRFDAHKGVANVIIQNSTLGHTGINVIGSGKCIIENTTVLAKKFLNLRSDYGSTWEGELIIRDCVFVPDNGNQIAPVLITGANSGNHDFGYTCYMPQKITFENFRIKDSNHPENYDGAAIFANFNKNMKDDSYVEEFPYVISNEVILKNVTSESGKDLRISDNTFMFKNVIVTTE